MPTPDDRDEVGIGGAEQRVLGTNPTHPASDGGGGERVPDEPSLFPDYPIIP